MTENNRHLYSRRIGTKHCVRLRKSSDGGFGIKIAERDNMFGTNRPIYITAITTTGSAYRDGRLKEGDMLLEVNGVDLSGKSQPEVTKMLKGVGINETVEFVVSRQNNMDGPGIYVYDIPLNDTKSAGLGLYLKYPTSNGKDLGVWIEKVITGGAAWKDGRLQPDDQILAINGINLLVLSNTDATDTLMAAVSRGIGPEATANTIRLNIKRRDPSVVAKILQGALHGSQSSNDTQTQASMQSWDDESTTGEERFQRDGFGRQSMSEKRHAQLMATNTDTFKRNQKLREEREQLAARLPRNRNESFRAAVESGRPEYVNSSATTSNEEGYLITNNNASNTVTTHKKSSSLLTKFLNFGSIKRGKKKNKDSQTSCNKDTINREAYIDTPKQELPNEVPIREEPKDISNHEFETTRSQTSKPILHTNMQHQQPNLVPNISVNAYNQQYLQYQQAISPQHNHSHPIMWMAPNPQQAGLPNGYSPNGLWVANPPDMQQRQAPAMTQQFIRYQQPQHIYYYDL